MKGGGEHPVGPQAPAARVAGKPIQKAIPSTDATSSASLRMASPPGHGESFA